MQIASILLRLGGDAGNTIPKFDVTPSEVAVLRAIHGEESVQDIKIYGDEKRSHREERSRLGENYGRQEDGRYKSKVVDDMFPGVAARLYETFEELALPEEFYKAESRRTPDVVEAEKPAPLFEDAPDAGAEQRMEEGPDAEGDEDDIGEIRDEFAQTPAPEAPPLDATPPADEQKPEGELTDDKQTSLFG